MKMLLVLAGVLLSPNAFAFDCEAGHMVSDDNATYVINPTLTVTDNDERNWHAPFGVREEAKEDFGTNLCVACGWGSSSAHLAFSGRTRGHSLVAVLNSHGQLVTLDDSRNIAYLLVKELTCKK